MRYPDRPVAPQLRWPHDALSRDRRGPLPPRVYWTRRLLVLVVALALVFGVARLLGGGGGGNGPSAQPVGADATSVVAASPTGDVHAAPGATAATVTSSPTASRAQPSAGTSATAAPTPTALAEPERRRARTATSWSRPPSRTRRTPASR